MPGLAVVAPFGFSFEPVRLLRAYAAVGVTTAQFYRNEQNPPTVAEALRAAEAAGVRYDSIHGVFGFHLDPSSDDPEHVEHCLKVYESEGRLASDLGGPMVVVHPSAWNPGMRVMPLAEVEATSAVRWPRADVFMRRLAEIGERLGVTYLIENQPFNCPLGHDCAEMARRVLAVQSPRLRMCLDTGHAHITSNVVESLRRAAPAIDYLHIHDNDAVQDDHRMPGDGTIDWAALAGVLRSTGLRAPRMLEVFYSEAKVEELGGEGLGGRLREALALG